MQVMEITLEDLIPGVDVAGAATVLAEAQQAQSQWFI